MKNYQELNDILVGTSVPMGVTVWSDWQDGYEWARKMVIRVSSAQAFDMIIQRRGSDGSVGQEIVINSITDVLSGNSRYELDYDFVTGMSFRIAVKNNSGASGNFKASVLLFA